MGTSIDSIIDVSFVALQVNLLEEPEQKHQFVMASEAEVDFVPRVDIVAADLSGKISGSDRFVLQRERIDVELKPSEQRNTITRKYPENADDLGRLAEIIHFALSLSDRSGSKLGMEIGYGYNIQLVFSQDTHDSSLAYLADKTIDPVLSERIGEDIFGANPTIYFRQDTRYWVVRLEPRYADQQNLKIFMAINYHVGDPDDTLPQDVEEIKSDLKTLWDRAHSLVADIDA